MNFSIKIKGFFVFDATTYYQFSEFLDLCGISSNSKSFQSSIKRIRIHKEIQIILLISGLFGKIYISNRFQTHLQTITIQTHTKKILAFEL